MIIETIFDASAEGWTISGDPKLLSWQASGGDPGGYLFWKDAVVTGPSYWVAPDTYHGDLSAFYEGTISFSRYASNTGGWNRADVVIEGANGHTLRAYAPEPSKQWTHVDLTLSTETQWHLDRVKGPLATADQIQAVLADVIDLRIRAEQARGPEKGGLDSVVLASFVDESADHVGSLRSHEAISTPAHGLDTSHVLLA